MSDAYIKLKETIVEQERLVRVDKFSNQDALDLGNFMVDLAREKGYDVAIAIRKPHGAVLFHHLMEGTNSNNQNWMRRKFNVVTYWEHSSLYAFAYEKSSGESMETHGESLKEFIHVGGGFPIFLKTGEMAAVLTVSNLNHFDDHQFCIEGLAKWAGIKDYPVVKPIE